jgi:hypothetical protein
MIKNQIITLKKKKDFIIIFQICFIHILFHFKKIVTGQIDYLRGPHVAQGCGLGTTALYILHTSNIEV